MTDEELISRLRIVTGFIRFETGDRIAASACLSEEAADRIEQLAVTNEALTAKLAKAVDAADVMLDAFCIHENSYQITAYEVMCAALAEIKGESHD